MTLLQEVRQSTPEALTNQGAATFNYATSGICSFLDVYTKEDYIANHPFVSPSPPVLPKPIKHLFIGISFSLRNLVQACWAEGEAKNIVGQIRGCRLLSTRGDSRLVPKSSSKKMVPARKKEREKGKNHTQDREKRVRTDCASRAAAGTGTLERTQTFSCC